MTILPSKSSCNHPPKKPGQVFPALTNINKIVNSGDASPSLQNGFEIKLCVYKVLQLLLILQARGYYRGYVLAIENLISFLALLAFNNGFITVFPCTMTIRLAYRLLQDPVFFPCSDNTDSSTLSTATKNSIWSLLRDYRSHSWSQVDPWLWV